MKGKFVNGTPVNDNDGDEGGGFHPQFDEMHIRKAGNGVVINTKMSKKSKGKGNSGSSPMEYSSGTDSVHTSAKSAIGHVLKHLKGGSKALLLVVLLSHLAQAQTVVPIIKATQIAPVFQEGKYYTPSMDLSGNLRVIVSGITVTGGNNAASTIGSAVPASGGYTAANVGGVLRGITATNTTGSVYALDVNIAGGGATGVAQDSTTGGQLGSLMLGAVTTSAPNYTTAHTSALSLQIDGSLRTAVTNVTHTICDSGCGGGSGGTSLTDGGTYTASSTSFTPIGGFYHSTRDSLADGKGGAMALNANRAGLIQIEDASKNAIPFPLALGAGGGMKIDGSGTALPISGTITANQGTGWVADADIGATRTSNPAQVGGVFETSPSTITNGQVAGFHFTNGQLLLISEPSPVSRAVTNAGTFAVQATQVYSGSASGVTASMTGTTSTSVIGGTASNYVYVESCSVNNTHASVDTLVDLQDGSGGTVLYTLDAPHGYGGESKYFGKPGLKVPTSGNGLFAVDKTTGAAVIVSCNGTKSTVSQ